MQRVLITLQNLVATASKNTFLSKISFSLKTENITARWVSIWESFQYFFNVDMTLVLNKQIHTCMHKLQYFAVWVCKQLNTLVYRGRYYPLISVAQNSPAWDWY